MTLFNTSLSNIAKICVGTVTRQTYASIQFQHIYAGHNNNGSYTNNKYDCGRITYKLYANRICYNMLNYN
jgi:hypothetical protein